MPHRSWSARDASEPQHHLRQDVALDLVRAAVDRGFAQIEIGRRERWTVFRPDRLAIPAVAQRFRLIGIGLVADRLHQQLGDALLDRRTDGLEVAHLWPGRTALRPRNDVA